MAFRASSGRPINALAAAATRTAERAFGFVRKAFAAHDAASSYRPAQK